MSIEEIAKGVATGVVAGAGTAYLAIRSWVGRTDEKLKTVERLELDVAGLQHDIRAVNLRHQELEQRTIDRYDELRGDIKDVARELNAKLDRLIENRFRQADRSES